MPLGVSVQPRHNVTAIGIGPKLAHGTLRDEECVRFYVEKKVPESAIPENFRLPREIDGVPTDVIEAGRFIAGGPSISVDSPAVPASAALLTTAPATGKFRPARGGCSCGFLDPVRPGLVMAGTLGVFVQRNGAKFILSNNHVIAAENALPLGAPIFQPGVLDGGDPTKDQIARLSKFVVIDPTTQANLDCAIAELTDPEFGHSSLLPKVNALASSDPIAAVVEMEVEKVGRTTGHTIGEVFDTSATVNVQYSFGVATFEDQVFVRGTGGRFSAPGDSGSLIVDRATKRGTALLFAGSDFFTAGNKLDAVLDALGVTLSV